MKIYHGSDNILKKPLFGKGKEDNDYGSGFYTTEIREKADEWALINGSETSAICNYYEIATEGLNILHLDKYGTLAWIAEIVTHRGTRDEVSEILGQKIATMYKINTDDADIIIGYRADDSYIDIVDAFLDNEVSLDEVERLFKKGELGEQVFIKSQKAFDLLVFKDYYDVTGKDFSNENEVKARKEVSEFLRNRRIQIQVEGFTPTGITAREAANHYYAYNIEYGYYYLSDEKPKNKSVPIRKRKQEGYDT